MNKPAMSILFRFFSLMAFLLLIGCKSSLFDDPYMTEIPEEKLKEVEALDLFSMAAEEAAPSITKMVEEPPETLELTLEQVRAMTIENNLNLKAELIKPTIAAAAATSTEARKYELIFQAGVNYYKTDFPIRDLDISSTQGEDTTLSAGLTTPLESGGAVGINLNDSVQKTNRSGTDYPSAYTAPLSLSLTQPLLKGAGRREFQHTIRLAKYDWQSASAAAKLQLIHTVALADQAYWELYKSRKLLEVRRQQLKLTQEQLESARRFVEAGEKPEVELLRAEAGMAGQQTDIIAAENAYRHSQRQLKYILNKPGLMIDGPTELIPQTEADPHHLSLDNQKLVTHAILNRMELIQLELEIARNASSIDHFRNAKLPSLDLQYMYVINSLGDDRDGAYDMLEDKDFENHRIYLSLSYPLGNYAPKNDLIASMQRRQLLEYSKADQQAFIEQEVLDAIDNLNSSWQQINATRTSARLDKKLYAAEIRQFEVSMRTSTEVLQAQARYADSVSAEYISLANYQIALMELARSTGTLLGAAQVE